MRHVKCYRKGYPRPQFVRDRWRDLCGTWKFIFDDDREGERERWFERFPQCGAIRTPFSYQTEASGVGDNRFHPCVWYEARFEYDPADFSGNRLLLHFEGCDYDTKVWVNGLFIGSHRGGYCRFSFDITDAVSAFQGAARIVVRAEDSLEAFQPRGKQSALGTSFGCWYANTTGIWKPVWTEFVPQISLARVKITPSVCDYYAEFEAELSQAAEGLSLRTVVTYDGITVSDTTSAFTRRILSFKADLSSDSDLFRVHYWTPESPKLYDVEFYLLRGETVIDKVGSYFGLADFRTQGNCLMLNCNPVYLKMALAQGYYRKSGLTAPDEEQFIADIRLAKELGFNGLRMHQKIEDERFYYYADILGMSVWCEMPSAYEYKSDTVQKVAEEWLEVVRQYYNHPSVFVWVPLNESWGVPRILTDPAQQAFSQSLYYLTKSYDPRRPVISNDGWEHTKSDIVTLHNYAQSAEELRRFYGDLSRMLGGGYSVDYSQTRLPFANGFRYGGEPVVISEFAGIGYQAGSDAGWGYGNKVNDAEEFTERLQSLVGALRKIDGISGFCVTQLTDVETEINGLTDIDRKPKSSIRNLREAVEQ